MKRIAPFSLAIAIILCIFSCGQSGKKELANQNKDTTAVQQSTPQAEPLKADKLDRFVGTWVDRATLENEKYGHIVIEKSGERFLIYPDHFYSWDGMSGLTGKTLMATYDEQNDKLIVSFGNFTKEMFYNEKDGSLIEGTHTLVQLSQGTH